MSIVSGSNLGLTSSANALATTPTIANISLPTADTEVSYALPTGTKRFALQNRFDGIIKLAYTANASGTTFYTVWPGDEYVENNLHYSAAITIYVQSPKPSQTIEIRSWV